MNVNSIQPLTPEESELAAQHLNQVDRFLRRMRLDPAEYYDVAIFGYLAAIQKYCRDPCPPEQQNLPALMKRLMERACIKEWNYRHTAKCGGPFGPRSLDTFFADMENDERSIYDAIPLSGVDPETQTVQRDLIERTLKAGTPRQLQILRFIIAGYKASEIAEMLGTAKCTVSELLYLFRYQARAVRDDRKVEDPHHKWRVVHREEYREKDRAYKKAWRKAHPEEARARDKANYAARKRRKAALDAANINGGTVTTAVKRQPSCY